MVELGVDRKRVEGMMDGMGKGERLSCWISGGDCSID